MNENNVPLIMMHPFYNAAPYETPYKKSLREVVSKTEGPIIIIDSEERMEHSVNYVVENNRNPEIYVVYSPPNDSTPLSMLTDQEKKEFDSKDVIKWFELKRTAFGRFVDFIKKIDSKPVKVTGGNDWRNIGCQTNPGCLGALIQEMESRGVDYQLETSCIYK